MFGSLLRLLAGCTVLVAGGWAAHAADPPVDADFVFWQDRLLGRESGIYENGDSVFVVSRVPVSSRTRIRAKEAALLESSSLLRNWAFEQARRDRGAEPARPADIAAMAVFNDKHSPGWRIPPWRIDALGRQLPTRESDGFLHQAQVYDRETLLRAIPDGYRRHPADDETATAFATIAQAAFRRDPESFSASVSIVFTTKAGISVRAVISFPAPGARCRGRPDPVWYGSPSFPKRHCRPRWSRKPQDSPC